MDDHPPLTVIAVSHTHWDREWYHPLGVMRARLAALIDDLLDTPDGLPFLLDGQAIVLDDYLAMRPERRQELRDALQTRQLEAGPWYVLADMLIPSGEALVRNLLAGSRAVRAAGGEPPRVLYSPDAFGHSAAGPVLAHGFGMGLAVVWRGFGGPSHPQTDVVQWRHPNGNSVLLYHLPPGGYEVGSSLPTTASDARAIWPALRATLQRQNSLGIVLLPNGADHRARQRDRAGAMAALAQAALPDRVEPGSLNDFATRLIAAAAGATLPDVRGELRDSRGWTWSLQGTFATRAHQKRLNAQGERLLVRDAEPWAAMAWFTTGWRGSTLQHAWTTLLAAHPHDTLCGCSVDAVAVAAEQRWAEAAHHAREVRHAALLRLLGHDPAAQRDREAEWRSVVVLQNPAARPRGGVVQLRLIDQVTPDPVGPGSASRIEAQPNLLDAAGHWSSDAPLQVLGRTRAVDRVESPQHYPRNAVVRVSDVLAWIEPLRGFALQSVPLADLHTLAQPAPRGVSVRASDSALNGPHWQLTHSDASVAATHGATGVQLPSLGWIESTTDAGDTYTPSLRGAAICATWSRPRVHASGPLRAAWELTTSLQRTQRAAVSALASHDEAASPSTTVCFDIGARVSLDAGADRIDVLLQGDNSAGDHRLRWVIPLPASVSHTAHTADTAFGAVERIPSERDQGAWGAEQELPTAPLHRWLWFKGATHGFGVISDGLAEYEVLPNGQLAITLLRAVGELSRRDLPERPGHAGWPMATPLAQCIGPYEARFALLALSPDSDVAMRQLEAASDDVLLSIRGETWRGVAQPHMPFAGMSLEGDGLVCSAIKQSEDGAWLVLRCINQRADAVRGTWLLPCAATEIRHSRLDEAPGTPIPLTGDRISFEAGPHAIVTLLVR